MHKSVEEVLEAGHTAPPNLVVAIMMQGNA
jgi:hypothetical protein